MTPTSAPWPPPNSTDVRILPAGRWWDAVKVPAFIGARALTLLGKRSGAVLEDSTGSWLYWLVSPGSTARWEMSRLQRIDVLGQTAYLAVPGQQRTGGPGPHWRVPPASGRCLTNATALVDALTTAVHIELGPREAPSTACAPLADQATMARTHDRAGVASGVCRSSCTDPECGPHRMPTGR